MLGKRLLDIALALLLASPALLIILAAAIAIRLDSPGPALFRQARLGRHRRPFVLIKLRTMHLRTAQRASHETPARRITRVGMWLRRTKIDELPQIWSILKGEMSFVGPRPNLPNQDLLIAEREARGVYALVPGITGFAQLAGIDMSQPRRLAIADARYLGRASVRTDLCVLLQTAIGGHQGDAVLAVDTAQEPAAPARNQPSDAGSASVGRQSNNSHS